ncbi:hypothetical protein [Yoonia vestfoldensis]|uniref:hypothetical protein n=1 Tax=Yoonia vestfoldensis TaxID=245188 RepID=UPI00035E2DA1|nr:hypothetical protein [Yoonia vestfoldensis]
MYDASHGNAQDYPRDVSYPIDLAWVQRKGLFPVKKWGWRAGDYALYRASEVCGPYDHMLMLDSDVFVHWPGFAGFLQELAEVEDDFLTLHVEQRPGPRRLAMLAHPSLDTFAQKRSCLFRLIRASKRLVAQALLTRRAYSESFHGSPFPFANDASIFATLAASLPGYRLSTFDQALSFPMDQRFHQTEPLGLGDFPADQMKRAVIHPLTALEDLRQKENLAPN